MEVLTLGVDPPCGGSYAEGWSSTTGSTRFTCSGVKSTLWCSYAESWCCTTGSTRFTCSRRQSMFEVPPLGVDPPCGVPTLKAGVVPSSFTCSGWCCPPVPPVSPGQSKYSLFLPLGVGPLCGVPALKNFQSFRRCASSGCPPCGVHSFTCSSRCVPPVPPFAPFRGVKSIGWCPPLGGGPYAESLWCSTRFTCSKAGVDLLVFHLSWVPPVPGVKVYPVPPLGVDPPCGVPTLKVGVVPPVPPVSPVPGVRVCRSSSSGCRSACGLIPTLAVLYVPHVSPVQASEYAEVPHSWC
ncbi:hypothetical protein CEXT_610391 [Caerostris extrusa]|uniref:Uncharacterized protein n=1 Tax=Caerostris extrusa TaxID=172846 RepID=A0AAV4P6M3_CAEEX|nr:hypothetical protein CEXT_610391 [Caerostris extrusa]